MKESIQKYSTLFKALSINKNSKIGIILQDSPSSVFSLFGALKSDFVPVIINSKFDVDKINFIIKNSDSCVIVTEKEIMENIDIQELPGLKYVILVDSNLNLEITKNRNFVRFQESQKNTSGDFIVYTSGTTGNPKGIVHNQKNMVDCVKTYGEEILKISQDDIIYSVPKMAHTYGLGNSTYQSYAKGATVILKPDEIVFDILGNISKLKPTIFFGVPSVYNLLLKFFDEGKHDFSSVRLWVSAGENLSKNLSRMWKDKFGKEIINGLGTTETLTTFLSNTENHSVFGSSGRAVKGFDIRLVDAQNKIVPDGQVGVMEVKGKPISTCYYNLATSTNPFLADGFFRTGDLFLKDENGYYWFSGRENNLFKINGKWVNPFEIEKVLLELDIILEALVQSEQGSDGINECVAYVVLADKGNINPDNLLKIKKYLKKNLQHFKCPKTLYSVSQLSKNANGKIIRNSNGINRSFILGKNRL